MVRDLYQGLKLQFVAILRGEGSRREAQASHQNASLPKTSRLLVCEDGKISFVTVIVVMVFVVLIGLVGNSGHSVVQKIELQNAADSAAYSTALWQARGMNAITTTNHLMGELTALLVLHEAIGGPTLRRNDEELSEESEKLFDEKLDKLKEKTSDTQFNAPYGGFGFLSDGMKEFDEQLITDLLCAEDSEWWMLGELKEDKQLAGAMLYDARLTLKYQAVTHMTVKKYLNQVQKALEEFKNSYLGIIVAFCDAAHVYASSELVMITREWLYLSAVEEFASLIETPRNDDGEMNGVKQIIRDDIILVLSNYADSIVGTTASSQSGVALGESLLQKATGETIVQMQAWYEQHDVEKIALYPSPATFYLPVQQELSPDVSSDQESDEDSNSSPPPSLYDKKLKLPGILGEIQRMMDDVLDIVGDFKKWLGRINDKLPKEVQSLFDYNGKSPLGAMDNVTSLVKKIDDLQAKVFAPKPLHGKDKWKDTDDEDFSEYPDNEGLGYPGNPSLHERDLPAIDWQAERYSQWVRATYPYVDSLRRPICGWLDKKVPYSNAETYYINWTNRYTLSLSHAIRSPGNGEEEDSDDSESGPFDRIQEFLDKIKELRTKLEKALEPSVGIDQVDNSISNELGNVSLELRQYVDSILPANSELMSALRQIPGLNIDNWIRRASGHVDGVQARADSASPPPDLELDPQEYEKFVYDVELAAALDELLQLVERITAQVEDFVNPLRGTPHMYVMRDSNIENKGNEPWTTIPQQSEAYFTFVAFAYRGQDRLEGSMFFAPLFPNPHDKGTVAYAQSMFYNAGGLHIDEESQPGKRQPNTGWDTLNWATPVRAPEWGASPSRRQTAGYSSIKTFDQLLREGFNISQEIDNFHDAWSVFWTRREMKYGDPSYVKLNWQAKLVPVTRIRTQQALNDKGVEQSIRDALKLLQQQPRVFDPDVGVITH